MGHIQTVDENNFETEVMHASLPVLVDFWAEWCPPCKKLGPTLEQAAEELSGRVKIVKVNTQEATALTAEYGIMNIPTMIIFRNGEEIARLIGNKPLQKLIEELESYL
ncbi:MAG: thioredoxin [Anaerolineae bacterium]|nr:thioredoxin [Anaerolineae bacterium]